MNTIITIGRQFGSAGREIGEKLAEELGIKCYGYLFLWVQCRRTCRHANQSESISGTI